MTSETLSFPDHKLQFTKICLLKFYTELGLQRKRCFISLKYDEKITNYIIFYLIEPKFLKLKNLYEQFIYIIYLMIFKFIQNENLLFKNNLINK